MTIAEAVKRQDALRLEILRAVHAFEAETGLVVYDVSLKHERVNALDDRVPKVVLTGVVVDMGFASERRW